MKGAARITILTIVVAMVATPAIYLASVGAFGITGDTAAPAADRLYPLVRLLGMLVFTGLTLQVLSMTLWEPLRRLFSPSALLAWHVTVGLLTYSLAILHPVTFDLTQYLATQSLSFLASFVPHAAMDRFQFLVMLGYLNLLLLTLTVAAGLLRKRAGIRRWWKKVHLLNYAVFAIGLYHSLNIGTDTQTGTIRTLWIIYAAVVALAILWRLGELWVKRQHRRTPVPEA